MDAEFVVEAQCNGGDLDVEFCRIALLVMSEFASAIFFPRAVTSLMRSCEQGYTIQNL